MQKTQVLKLNTSKDNVQAFFDKMKNKLAQHQTKGENVQNFDITMIVKHQSKNSFKDNTNQRANQKQNTIKSILTENDQNVQSLKNKKQKPKIYDEQMRVESKILATELSIKKQSYEPVKNLTDRKEVPQKVRDSNKMPSLAQLFHFQKKKDQVVQSSGNSKTKKSNFSNSIKENHLNAKDKLVKDKIESDDESSQSSESQEFQEQELKKHVSRRHIDIFPNIQLDGVVSQKLLSLKNLKINAKKQLTVNNNNRRRCSINDENLLSPRIKILSQEVKLQSTKEINELLKSKLNSQRSLKQQFQADDCINEAKQGEQEVISNKSIEKNQQNLQTQEFNVSRTAQLQKRKAINRTLGKKTTRQRSSALAKNSMFQIPQGGPVKKTSRNKIEFNEQKQGAEHTVKNPTNHHLHIQTQPHQMKETEETDSESQNDKSSSSSNEQSEDSIYVIENKLNDCIQLLEKNQLSALQEFLYEFKDKYFFISNTRIQIKWRLLMAHCKENKKEYERAAINYNNVIQIAKQNPKSLIIEPAEVYHRLGVCYSQIGWWNKGILAFTQALNRYKRSKNAVKYAQSMNNLGTLYLQAQSINLAEKCFIQSYNLKKSLYGKNNTKLLTSLFNIFECNLITKNYDQAQKVIEVIQEEIINQIPQNQPNKLLYLGGLYRRKGKMEFMRGNIDEAQTQYLKAFEKLSNKYPYCMQFGQLMSCLGILKLQDNKYRESKQYYDKAIMLMNFYCSKDSKTIVTLKKNLEYAVKMIKEQKQGMSSKRSGIYD